MKKIVLIVFLIINISLAMWAAGTSELLSSKVKVKRIEPEIELVAGKIHNIGIISISTMSKGIFASSLELTNNYQHFRPYKLFAPKGPDKFMKNSEVHMVKDQDGKPLHILGTIGAELGNMYPLINLDLYGKDKFGNKIAIEDMKAKVTVIISYKKLREHKIYIDKEKLFFLTFIAKEGIWVPMGDPRSGSSNIIFDRLKDEVRFTVSKWPVNDRLVACGP